MFLLHALFLFHLWNKHCKTENVKLCFLKHQTMKTNSRHKSYAYLLRSSRTKTSPWEGPIGPLETWEIKRYVTALSSSYGLHVTWLKISKGSWYLFKNNDNKVLTFTVRIAHFFPDTNPYIFYIFHLHISHNTPSNPRRGSKTKKVMHNFATCAKWRITQCYHDPPITLQRQ